MKYLHLAAGLGLLFFGRNLFWLLVGLTGFLLGVELVTLLLPHLQPWLMVLTGTLALVALVTLFVVGVVVQGSFMRRADVTLK